MTEVARRLGKTPVQVTDRAGFVANALLLPYLNHAARLLETGYATREDIDLAVTAGIGLPMGPLALLDLIGLDTSLAILEVLDREFGGTRYTPAPLLRRLTDAGRTGRKSGAGFYDYPGAGTGRRLVRCRQRGPAASSRHRHADRSRGDGQESADGGGTASGPADGSGPHSDRAAELASLIAAAGISVTRNPAHPSDLVIVAIGPEGGVIGPATAAGRAADAVGLHLATRGPGRARRRRPADLGRGARRGPALLIARLGLRAVRSADRPGLLVGALLYPHLRDAVAMVADGYATPADVDAAMTLGCGYPRGPIRLLADAGVGSRGRGARGDARGLRRPGLRAAAADDRVRAGRPVAGR